MAARFSCLAKLKNRAVACTDGFKGANCDIKCKPYLHGPECTVPFVCGSHCKIGACTSDTTCVACVDGFMGDNCETACDAAHHGQDCTIACALLD